MNNLLWTAIYDLFLLLDGGEQRERIYQEFFEKHPVVFEALGFSAAQSFEKRSGNRLPYDKERNYQPEPDFICARSATGELVVFEIKTPASKPLLTSRNDGNRKKFREDVNSYVSQTTEYTKFLAGNLEARNAACRVLGMTSASIFSGVLVYGRSSQTSLAELAAVASGRYPPISITTYDQIIDTLADEFSKGRADVFTAPETNEGTTFLSIIRLNDIQKNKVATIAHIGEAGGDNIRVFVEDRTFKIAVATSGGSVQAIECDVPFNKPFYFKLECSATTKRKFILVTIDNMEVDIRQTIKSKSFSPDFNIFVLGADINGQNGAQFDAMSNLFRAKTLDLLERLQMQKYVDENYRQPKGWLSFNGEQFLRRTGEDHLVQAQLDCRPIYRER